MTTNGKAPEATKIEISLEQGVADDGKTPVLTLTIPATTEGLKDWVITLQPAGWGLMEYMESASKRLNSEAGGASLIIGEFLDEFAGGRDAVPFWLAGTVFNAVTQYVERYKGVTLKN